MRHYARLQSLDFCIFFQHGLFGDDFSLIEFLGEVLAICRRIARLVKFFEQIINLVLLELQLRLCLIQL